MERYAPDSESQAMGLPNVFTESSLITHDIALFTINPQTGSHTSYPLLLLSPEDVDPPQALVRVEQLCGHNNSHDAAVIFLLHHPEGIQAAMRTFMELHIKLATKGYTLPIIPAIPTISITAPDPSGPTDALSIAAAAAIASALQTFHASLTASRQQPADERPDALRELLPCCTVGHHPPETVSTAGGGGDGGGSHALTLASSRLPSSRAVTVEAFSRRWSGLAELVAGVGSWEGEDRDGVKAFWEGEFAV
ncbi:hypothetical protein VTJ49DRAFT_5670 [Mycothermus thermophilus]|uniref:Uncharacterized protein n=1 Tax=Humicola insolens TaxID=85995 RepID=A0ABR3VKH4_HUMIN